MFFFHIQAIVSSYLYDHTFEILIWYPVQCCLIGFLLVLFGKYLVDVQYLDRLAPWSKHSNLRHGNDHFLG